MIHKELNKKNVLELSFHDFAQQFALHYVNELYDRGDDLLVCKNIVDTVVYIVEVSHPKAKDVMPFNKRLQIAQHLSINCKEGLIAKGATGIEHAISHAINIITRFMLANERTLRVVK